MATTSRRPTSRVVSTSLAIPLRPCNPHPNPMYLPTLPHSHNPPLLSDFDWLCHRNDLRRAVDDDTFSSSSLLRKSPSRWCCLLPSPWIKGPSLSPKANCLLTLFESFGCSRVANYLHIMMMMTKPCTYQPTARPTIC